MDFFEKRATTPAQARRLEHEAAVLRAVAHPGVVALVSVAPGRIVLRRVDGPSLDQVGPVPLELLAGWAAALTTVVADLHDLGYVHGSLRADHILIDPGGRPVLCGLGAARRPAAGAELAAGTEADVADMVALITERLGSSPGETKLRRRLARGRFRARTLARLLVQWVPAAYVGPPVDGRQPAPAAQPEPTRAGFSSPVAGRLLAGPGRTAGARLAALAEVLRLLATNLWSWSDGGRLRRISIAGFVGLVAMAGVWVAASAGTHRSAANAGPNALVRRGVASGLVASGRPAAGPDVVAGPGGQYRLESASPLRASVAVGRWGCGPDRPAVLDVRSGAVWVFPGWPAPGSRSTARLVARVAGAKNLVAVTSGAGCNRLVVDLRSGAPVYVEVEP